MRRLAAVFLFFFATLCATSGFAQVGGSGPAGVSGKGSSRFAGSMVSLRPTASALSLDKAAEPTWNPYVATQVMLAPRMRLTKRISLSAMLIAAHEHTANDWTTEAGETTLSDTFLTTNVSLVRFKSIGLGLGASFQVRAPTSKASQARTMLFGLLGGLSASWSTSFKIAGHKQAVSVMVLGRVGRFIHRQAEASLETPWLSECGSLPGGCARYAHAGVRNLDWRTQIISALSYRPHPRVGISAQIGSFYDLLAPLPTTTVQGYNIAADPTDPNARGIAFYILSASFQPSSSFAIAAGTETAARHLAPDSSYRAPFFNRNTLLFVSLRVFPAALYAALAGS